MINVIKSRYGLSSITIDVSFYFLFILFRLLSRYLIRNINVIIYYIFARLKKYLYVSAISIIINTKKC